MAQLLRLLCQGTGRQQALQVEMRIVRRNQLWAPSWRKLPTATLVLLRRIRHALRRREQTVCLLHLWGRQRTKIRPELAYQEWTHSPMLESGGGL